MPEAGEYLFSSAGFSSSEKPYLTFQKTTTSYSFMPFGKTITLHFNTTKRFCVGWYDMAKGKEFSCPNQQVVEEKYDQCPACQKRTGFNPAFYHAAIISPQQEARNQEPHMLYLAHFGPGIIKVGISYGKRGIARLLEQGARSTLILDTFPSALIARQYEARIVALPGIIETLQLRKKIELLTVPYSPKTGKTELIECRKYIEQTLSIAFGKHNVLALDQYYFLGKTPSMTNAHNLSDQAIISGNVMGMLGTLLFCQHQDSLLYLPLKKYTGYRVELSYSETFVPLPKQQISLF